MDALGTILRSIRLESTLLSRAHLAPPFSVESAGMPTAVFHAVVAGECWIHVPSQSGAHHLCAGDVVIVGREERHVIASPADRSPIPLTALGSTHTRGGVPFLELGGGPRSARIICGTMELEHPAAEGFGRLLPSLLPLRPEAGPRADWMRATLELLDLELDSDGPGASSIVTRLVDVIVSLAVRRASRDEADVAGGWLAAVSDPQIGQALALIHARPAHDWTAAELASEVGLSRTRLFEQFASLVGETPARYLGRWRVQCAADLMRQPSLSLLEIAERVGYGSEDSLSRAFKRIMGSTASRYRRESVAGD